MKLSKYALALSLTLLSTNALAGVHLDVDPAHSNIGFDVKHLMVSTVHGNFTNFTGAIDLDAKDMTKTKVQFTVQAASVNTSNEKRDGHLKSADFFDVAKYPEAKFVSASIKADGKDKYVMEGALTIHGVTKQAKFELLSLGKIKDPYGVEKYIFQAVTDLSRKDYGLTYNATLESGGVVISDAVKLTVDVEAAVPAPAKK